MHTRAGKEVVEQELEQRQVQGRGQQEQHDGVVGHMDSTAGQLEQQQVQGRGQQKQEDGVADHMDSTAGQLEQQ